MEMNKKYFCKLCGEKELIFIKHNLNWNKIMCLNCGYQIPVKKTQNNLEVF